MEMQKKPLVTVVMCVYNGERYLVEQLDSVINQSYSNFELLILDDCSTDNSYSILEQYRRDHSNIKLIKNEVNLGYNRNFEKGILLSEGDLISICDQDDVWLPDKLEELVTNIGNAQLIYSDSELIDSQGQPLGKKLSCSFKHLDNPDYKALLDINFMTGHTFLFRQDIKDKILPLPDSSFYYDKWIGLVAAYIGEVKYHNCVLTKYRVHQNSVVQNDKKAEKVKGYIKNRIRAEIRDFSNLSFINPKDRHFVHNFLKNKSNADKNLVQFMYCYIYLLKHHNLFYPWYAKSFFKKINFLRKQCMY